MDLPWAKSWAECGADLVGALVLAWGNARTINDRRTNELDNLSVLTAMYVCRSSSEALAGWKQQVESHYRAVRLYSGPKPDRIKNSRAVQ